MAWIGAAIGAAGGIIGGLANSSSAQSINSQNIALAEQEESWQEQMSDTAEQRHVADLQAAGLNPALAYQTPAPVPSAAPLPQLTNPRPGDAVIQGTAQGVSAYQQQQQINSTTALQNAQAQKASADAATTMAQLPFAGATAQQQYSNMKAAEDKLQAEFDNITQDTGNKMDANARAEQTQRLSLAIDGVNLQRAQLGLPRIQNDAAWQKLHPQLSGWLQSGSSPAAEGAVNSAMKVFSAF